MGYRIYSADRNSAVTWKFFSGAAQRNWMPAERFQVACPVVSGYSSAATRAGVITVNIQGANIECPAMH
jgi:hypothetical protein